MAMEKAFSFQCFSFFPAPLLLLLLLLFIAVISSRGRPKKQAPGRLPPGPWPLPIFGHLHLLSPPVHQAFHRLAIRHGSLVQVHLGSTRCVVVSSADMARELVRAHDTEFADRPLSIAARRFAYDSAGFAFAPYGPYWRFMKRLCMSELLGPRTVDQFHPVRRAELATFLRTVRSAAERGEVVDIGEEAMRMANDGIVRMVASTTPRETEEARELVKQVAELVGAFNLDDHVGLCRGWDLQGLTKRIEEVHRRFDRFLETIIKGKLEERRRRREKRERGHGDDEVIRDVLDILLDVSEDEKAEIKLSYENIKSFVLDIFTAASDSSAATIEWALTEMINHPRVLLKLREEIDGVVGTARLVEETNMADLPYLQAVVREVMRLHPAAPLAIRESTTDIDVCGFHIPARTTIFVNSWSIGRDPNYWTNPLEFRPERFLSEAAAIDVKGQHFQLVPFGSGRRICPGITLALKVVTQSIAALVQCFEWEASGGGGGEEGRRLDVEEKAGMVAARANPLLLVPKMRLNPFPPL